MFGVVWDQKKSIFDVVWGIKSIQFKKIAADKLRDRTSLGGLTRTRQAVSWSQPSFKSMLDTSRTSAEPSRLACWVVIYTVEVGLSWCETSLNASPPTSPPLLFRLWRKKEARRAWRRSDGCTLRISYRKFFITYTHLGDDVDRRWACFMWFT